MSWRRREENLLAVVSVQCWSIIVDFYHFLHLPPDLIVLLTQHLDMVQDDWVTCQIDVFLDHRALVVAISMLLEPLTEGSFSLSDILFMTLPTLHLVDQPTLFLQWCLILRSYQLGSEGVEWLVVRRHTVCTEHTLEVLQYPDHIGYAHWVHPFTLGAVAGGVSCFFLLGILALTPCDQVAVK